MEKIIEFNNINFQYDDLIVFKDFSLSIFNQNTCIIGTSSSGKTTISKLLSGLYLNDNIKIYETKLNKKNLLSIRKKLMVVNNEYCFISETVADELAFGMENLKISNNEMRDRINFVADYFNIQDKLNNNLLSLSKSDQTLIKILSFLVMKPKAIVFDDILIYLNNKEKEKIFKYLKENEIIFINITTDIEEVLYSDYLILLDKGKIIIEGRTKSVIAEEKIMKRFGFNLPFAFDLSTQLQIYGIIDKPYYDVNKIIGEIWK